MSYRTIHSVCFDRPTISAAFRKFLNQDHCSDEELKEVLAKESWESGSIEQDADVVILLHRPDWYHRGKKGYIKTNNGVFQVAMSRKPAVKHYVQTEILPNSWKQEILDLEEKLADPVRAYVDYLLKCTKAQTSKWIGPGQRCYENDNKTQLRAVCKIGRILGVTSSQATIQRDLEKAIFKHAAKLEARLQLLKEKLRAAEEAAEREKENEYFKHNSMGPWKR